MSAQLPQSAAWFEAALEGDIDALERLLNSDQVEHVDVRNSQRDTALLVGARAGKMEVVRWCLENGADEEAVNVDARGLLTAAVCSGSRPLVEYLLKERNWSRRLNARPSYTYGSTSVKGMLPLVAAVTQGHVEIARVLLDHGADADPSDSVSSMPTPLMFASSRGSLECCRLLVERGADVNVVLRWGSMTALGCAAKQGRPEVVEFLLEHGANGECVNLALVQAVAGSSLEVARVLLDGGVTTCDAASEALAEAGRVGMHEIIPALLKCGASVRRDSDATAPRLASYGGHTRTVRVLIEEGLVSEEAELAECLFLAAANGHGDTVDLLVECGAPVVGSAERVPLVACAGSGLVQMVARLLQLGAPAEVVDACGRSPLSAAARHGRVECVERLLAAGAPPRAPALHEACRFGHVDVIRVLLGAGAALDAASRTYRQPQTLCPLGWAAQNDQIAVIKELIDAGARVDGVPGVSPPLLVAAQSCKHAALEALLAAGADPNVAGGRFGLVPLAAAVRAEDVGGFDVLVRNGADPMVRMSSRRWPTLFHTAFRNKYAGYARHAASMTKWTRVLLRAGALPSDGLAAFDGMVTHPALRARPSVQEIRAMMEMWSEHRFRALLLGMRSPESSVCRFARQSHFDRNVLGLVFELVDGKEHKGSFKRRGE